MCAELIVGMAAEPGAEILIGHSVGKVFAQQAFDGFGNERRWAAIANGPRDRRVLAYRPAETEVVSVGELAFVLDLLAFDSDVGDPMLAASVGATGHVELELLVEARQALFEFIDNPA